MDRPSATWKPIVFVATLAGLAASTIIFPEIAEVTGPPAMLISYTTGGLVALRHARANEGRERIVWSFIGAGLLSAASGITLVFLLEAFGVHPPAFGPIDIFFICGYVGVLVGAALLPNAFSGGRDLARTLIDGIVGAISVGALGWILVVGDLVDYFNAASSWTRWLGTAYPLLDVLTIVLVVTLLSRRSRYRLDIRLSLLAFGAVFQVLGDLTFLASGVGSSFGESHPIYPIFIAASGCLTASAYFADAAPKPREYTERTIHYLAAVAPYGTAVTLATVTLFSLPYDGLASTPQLLTAATLVVGVLVIARQSLSIHDNRIHVDRKRSDLVSSISHELRTPLTAVVGFLDLMNDPDSGLTDDERFELVAVTSREANRMSRIVADVVLLTRYRPYEIALVEEATPVITVIEETLHTIEAGSAHIEVMAQEGLVATFDRVRVQQVLVNLVENAVRYGGGEIAIVAQNRGGDLTIEVHDNGPGVPKHDRHIVWQRFERGAHRFNAAIPGTGVGLAVVAAVASSHGGSATYEESDILGGACFRINLPDRCLDQKPSPPRPALQTTLDQSLSPSLTPGHR
jgi:signal transduction histidine kinase